MKVFSFGISVILGLLVFIGTNGAEARAEEQVCLPASEVVSLIDQLLNSRAAPSVGAGTCTSNATKKGDCDGCTSRGTCDNCCQNIDDQTERTDCYSACKTQFPNALTEVGATQQVRRIVGH